MFQIHSPTDIDIPVPDTLVMIAIDPEPVKVNDQNNFCNNFTFLFQSICHIFNITTVQLRGVLVAPVGHIWNNYYHRVEGAVVMPPSTFNFIITALLGLVEIKSQGNNKLPFETHPHAIRFSVTSLIMYGLASAVELVVSASGLQTRIQILTPMWMPAFGTLMTILGCVVYLPIPEDGHYQCAIALLCLYGKITINAYNFALHSYLMLVLVAIERCALGTYWSHLYISGPVH